MKFIQFLLACLILSVSTIAISYSREAKPIPGKIVIKFKENSTSAMKWNGSGRTGEIPFLKSMVGEHSSRPYLGDNVLKAVAKRLSDQNPKRTSTYSLTESLSRICIVEISSPLDVLSIIPKLKNNREIEYAEPIFERTISEIPNDPFYTSQRFLFTINAYDAWDVVNPPSKKPIVAIVDTGVDYLHEDLAGNIYINPGEDGNKRDNGIDDDGNGFIDDWHGWDFTAVGSSSAQDNDPMPGHPHGTHVAGIAGAITGNQKGVASVGRFVQILPVKIGPSDPNALSVFNSYEGILYAAAVGADVINTSWGGAGGSDAEQEVINAARALGSLIVAAAGNDDVEVGFYPAAYTGVLSVASVDDNDRKSSFSNYHRSVDVAAPGDDIFSTVPNNNYDFMSGTSMASPVAAGVAALIAMRFPNYTALQIGEHLKATTDNIDNNQSSQYIGKIGTGRVNAYRAVTETTTKAVVLTNIVVEDATKDNIFEAGEELELIITVHNVLSPIRNAKIEVVTASGISPAFLQNDIFIGDMATGDIITASSPVVLKIPNDIPFNYEFDLTVLIKDDEGVVSREGIMITVRPTYRTFSANNITATFNSEGNIGFNDYPNNTQGVGFLFKNSDNLLYEGAFMAGVSRNTGGVTENMVSNSARNGNASQFDRDRSFNMIKVLGTSSPGILAVQEGETIYADDNDPREDAGISVRQQIYQFDDPGREDFIIVSYDITNISNSDFSNLYAGLFFDWDIGTSGRLNQANFSGEHGFGYVLHTQDASLPWTGARVLSHQPNFYAIDNDGSGGSINIYNGFVRNEKWTTLQGRRQQSSVGDVSFVISAGPLKLQPGNTTRVAFSLFAGKDFNEIRTASENSLKTSTELGIATTTFVPTPDQTRIISVYPNPAVTNTDITINYALAADTYVELRIIDILGKTVLKLVDGERNAAIQEPITFKSNALPQGQYFVQLITQSGAYTTPFVIFR